MLVVGKYLEWLSGGLVRKINKIMWLGIFKVLLLQIIPGECY